MLKNKHNIKYFSESFKLKILSELSDGKYTKMELSRLYNIGYSTINDWVHKYGRQDLMNQKVIVQTMDELSRIQALQNELAKLKELLIKKDLDALVLDSYLEVAAKELGFKNVAELKKARHKAMREAMKKLRPEKPWSISLLCESFGMKRDAFYKYQRRNNHLIATKTTVLYMVKERRKEQSREGCKKMHKAFREEFQAKGIKLGRDKLFDILRENNLLVKRKRSYVKTTNSFHRFYKYNNLIKELKINRPNQVWVSDITYIRLTQGHCYLALITDVYSRKIVGYDISNSLELAGCIRALKLALLHARPSPGLIHHSDRGLQYCSNQYIEQLKNHKIQISMTEENHCYENAIAERVNGILKDEFYLDQNFLNLDLAKKATKNAIKIYNTKRLHLSLSYKTPEEVFKMTA